MPELIRKTTIRSKLYHMIIIAGTIMGMPAGPIPGPEELREAPGIITGVGSHLGSQI